MGFGFKDGAGSGMTGCTLTVTAPAGVTVTISKDGKTKTNVAGDDGVAFFKGLKSGEWTVTITDGDQIATDTVNLATDYTKEMSFPTPLKIYGIYRDITASSPEWAREDDAVGMTATASVGTVAGSSDFDNCYPWSGMVRETLSTGDVMVKIPKFWYRRYRDGDIEHIKISNMYTDGFAVHPAFAHGGVEKDCLYVGAYKASSGYASVSGAEPLVSLTRAQFRSGFAAKGDGWGMIDIAAWSAIQMLFLVEFATNDSQSAIGQGVFGQSAAVNVGSCDSVPNLTGRPAGTDGAVDVVWRGIEGLWGNVNEFIDGINFNVRTLYICNEPSSYADGTSSNYTKLSYTAPAGETVYIKQVGLDTDNPHIMLPSAAGGSSSTYYCDTCITASSWETLRVGGYYGTSVENGGLFMCNGNQPASFTGKSIGSRLQYIPQ